jgi:DNA-binding response OmpR family regulator
VSKRKLLLADDSITIQKVVNLTFADEGIEVISVGDGDSAMRKFDEFIPDLVMADVNMPGLNGYEVCRIIKRTEETQNIPVILLVGSFEPFDEAEAKDAGADDFLTKPFQSIRQLVNKVTDLLNQRERISETPPGEVQTEPVVDTFAETLEFEKQNESPAAYESPREEISSEFGDAGMDDEMIETSPANDYVSGSEYQADTAIDYAKTQPLNDEDLKGFTIIPGETAAQETPQTFENEPAVEEMTAEIPERAEAASFDEEARKLGETPYYEEPAAEEEPGVISETEPEIDYYLPTGDEEERPEEFEKEISDAETLAPEISYAPEESREADFSEAPEEEPAEPVFEETGEMRAVEEVPETEETPAVSETEETFTDESPAAETAEYAGFSQEAEVSEVTESDFDEQAETEPVEPEIVEATPESETSAETPVYAASHVPPLNFDDGDLLELPPLVEETGIRPQPKVEPVAAPAEPETAATEAEAETAEPPAAVTESQTMQAFPPELIEAIAQKVAEKISAKTMNDVLPQITELVMKKMAEENQENKR